MNRFTLLLPEEDVEGEGEMEGQNTIENSDRGEWETGANVISTLRKNLEE